MNILIIMSRMGVIAYLCPVLGGKIITQSVKVTLLFSFSLFLYPIFQSSIHDPTELLIHEIAVILCKEVFLGLVMAFFINQFLWLMEAFGFMIDQTRGDTQSQVKDTITQESTSTTGNLLHYFSLNLFYAIGLAYPVFKMIYSSYIIWNPFTFYPDFNNETFTIILNSITHFSAIFLLLIAPFFIISLMIDLGLGLVNRFASGLEVFFIGQPIKSLFLIFYIWLTCGHYNYLITRMVTEDFGPKTVLKFFSNST